MRIGARYELAEEWIDRYAAASCKETGEILTAFCLAAGYHRKYAPTLLRGSQRRKPRLVRPMRRRRYGPESQQALKVVWEAAGHICSERLHPFIGDLVLLLKRHGQLEVGLPDQGAVARCQRGHRRAQPGPAAPRPGEEPDVADQAGHPPP